MLFTISYSIALIICIATVFVLAIKGFQEIIEPFKLERAMKQQKKKEEENN